MKVNYRFAMILVLYAYGGWNEMAYVGAEVRRPEKNILRALLLGTSAVDGHLRIGQPGDSPRPGLAGHAKSTAVAADVLQRAIGPTGR